MTIYLFISLFLFILAGVCNGAMDRIAHHDNLKHLGYFWSKMAMENSKYSGISHFENGVAVYIRKKWFGIIPVWNGFLDGWHLSKSAMLWSISFGAAIWAFHEPMNILLAGIGVRMAFGAGFYFTYK